MQELLDLVVIVAILIVVFVLTFGAWAIGIAQMVEWVMT